MGLAWGWTLARPVRFLRDRALVSVGVSFCAEERELRSCSSSNKSGGVGSRSNNILQGASMASLASKAAASNAPGVISAM